MEEETTEVEPAAVYQKKSFIQRWCFWRCCRNSSSFYPLGVRPFLFGSKLNVLFVIFCPLAFLSESLHWGEAPTFILAMLAIMPLAERLGYLTEELSWHTTDSISGLLNATLGNMVELLISIVSLEKAKESIQVGNFVESAFFLNLIQTSLLGSMIGNLLLVQGSSYFIGGLKHKVQTFSRDGAITSAGLLVLSTLGMGVPTMLFSSQDKMSPTDHQLGLSHFVSICLLFIYCCFLLFQLKTHRFMFEKASALHEGNVEFDRQMQGFEGREPIPQNAPRTRRVNVSHSNATTEATVNNLKRSGAINGGGAVGGGLNAATIADVESGGVPQAPNTETLSVRDDDSISLASVTDTVLTNVRFFVSKTYYYYCKNTGVHHRSHRAEIGFIPCLIWLGLSTVAIAFISHIIVEAAEGAVHSLNLNEMFVGGVIIPLVGNAAEHFSAIIFAYRDKMDTSLAIAVGSAIQIPLFVLPFLVLVGWGEKVPLTLNLNQFMLSVVVVTSLSLSFNLHAGTTHWLHGLILIIEYFIIAAAFFFGD